MKLRARKNQTCCSWNCLCVASVYVIYVFLPNLNLSLTLVPILWEDWKNKRVYKSDAQAALLPENVCV